MDLCKTHEMPKIRQRGPVPVDLGASSSVPCEPSPGTRKGSITSMVVPKGAAAGAWSLRPGEQSCGSRGQLEADSFPE